MQRGNLRTTNLYVDNKFVDEEQIWENTSTETRVCIRVATVVTFATVPQARARLRFRVRCEGTAVRAITQIMLKVSDCVPGILSRPMEDSHGVR